MIEKIFHEPDLWEILSDAKKPIVLYGMGDGGDKILNVCEHFGIPVAAVFASDGFVRDQNFRGYTVRTLAQVEAEFGRCIVLLAFATSLPDVLADIENVARRHVLYAPDVPVVSTNLGGGHESGDTHLTGRAFGGGHCPLFTRQYALSRLDDAQTVYDLLADAASREAYLDILRYKLSGELQYLHACASSRALLWQELIKPGGDEVFIDAGAYKGDTVEEFLQACGGKYAAIHALEPDRRNFAKLKAYAEGLMAHDIHCHNVGAWSQSDMLPFAHKSGRQAALSSAGALTSVDSIDNLLGGSRASIVKYDVEGAEAHALMGTRYTIEKYAPRLIVSAYHRSEDLFELPLLVHRLNPRCKLYLRKHPGVPAWDINLVAL